MPSGIARPGRTSEHERVREIVRCQGCRAEQHLRAACEARRIEHWKEVALDEASRVPGHATVQAQPVLERSQRADPPGPFHEDTPSGCRELDPCSPRPAQDKKTSG